MSVGPLSHICPLHRHRTQLLNADFIQNGRIPDALSILYYPQNAGVFTTLQVLFEGNCYSTPYRYGPIKMSFEAHLYNMRHTDRYETYVRIGINISPDQLNNIRSIIDVYDPGRKTTERTVNDCLERFADLSLPLYLTQWNNTATAFYLHMQKKLGNRRIGIIRLETDRVTILKRNMETFCIGLDCATYAVVAITLISCAALVINIIAKVIFSNLQEMEEREPQVARISGYLM